MQDTIAGNVSRPASWSSAAPILHVEKVQPSGAQRRACGAQFLQCDQKLAVVRRMSDVLWLWRHRAKFVPGAERGSLWNQETCEPRSPDLCSQETSVGYHSIHIFVG